METKLENSNNRKQMKYLITKSIIIVFTILMLFSCENPIAVVQEIAKTDTMPTVSAFNIEYQRTVEAKEQVVLKSPQMDRFANKKDPHDIFPEGFEVTFYDTLGNKTSFISAKYGISYTNSQIMEARNNVIVKNLETQEQLNSENLVWDQKKKIIYTNGFVKITSPDKVIFGDSLWATQDFSKRRIHKIKDSFFVVDEDSLQ